MLLSDLFSFVRLARFIAELQANIKTKAAAKGFAMAAASSFCASNMLKL
jgi:hypothetical protein